MKLSLLGLFICVLLAACSRQPVGVDASLPGPSAPASPAPDAPRPTNDGTEDRMNEPMTDPPTNANNETLEPTATDPINRTLPTTEEATNGTANIENQGSVGQAPLTDQDTRAATLNTPVMSFQKSACSGKCDVYKLELMPNNLALLSVTKGLMGKGNYQLQLTDLQASDLNSAINTLRPEIFQEYYPVGEEAPGNAQFTRLVLPDKEDNLRSIVVYYDAPTSLTNFIKRLDNLIDAHSWRPREYARE